MPRGVSARSDKVQSEANYRRTISIIVSRHIKIVKRMIENVGLKPDVVQKQPGNETDDLQLKAAITQLNYQLDGES